MTLDSSFLLSIDTFIYGLASLLYLICWVFRTEIVGMIGTWVAYLACAGNTVGIVWRWIESYQKGSDYGHAPFSNTYESLVFFAWTIGVTYLVIERRYKNRTFGVFALPLAFFALAFASLHTGTDIVPLLPALKSNWLIAHVMTCFIGYASFAVACGAGFVYLVKNKESYEISLFNRVLLIILSVIIWSLGALALVSILSKVLAYILINLFGWSQPFTGFAFLHVMDRLILMLCEAIQYDISPAFLDVIEVFLVVCAIICGFFHIKANAQILKRLPELRVIDELIHQLIMFGFLFLSVGIITGAVWAFSAWGRYWGWDPKETWSFITWLVYAALLHMRMMRGWRGTRIAVFAVIGFACVLFTYFGVNFLLSGLHSYGSLKG